MLDGQFWIIPTHPKGIGWSSVTPENTVPLVHRPMLGGALYPSSRCMASSAVILGSWGILGVCSRTSQSTGQCFSMDIIQAVCAIEQIAEFTNYKRHPDTFGHTEDFLIRE